MKASLLFSLANASALLRLLALPFKLPMMTRPAIYVTMLDAHILFTAMTQTPENFQLHCKVLAGEPQLIRALQSVVLFQTTVQLGEHGHPCCVSTRRLNGERSLRLVRGRGRFDHG